MSLVEISLLFLSCLLSVRGFVDEESGTPQCSASNEVVCRRSSFLDAGTSGSLSLDCSGTDYILIYNSEFKVLHLYLYAECSSPCEEDRSVYYNDATSVDGTVINDMKGIAINGSDVLKMPSTLEGNCTVFGCYKNKFTSYYFINASCIREKPLTENHTSETSPSFKLVSTAQNRVSNESSTTLEPQTTPVENFSSETTESFELASTAQDNSSNSSTTLPTQPIETFASAQTNARSGNTLGSGSTPPSEHHVNLVLMRAGIPVLVVSSVLAIAVCVLLLIGFCHHYHKNKLNVIVQLHYNEKIEKMFDNTVFNDDFEVYKDEEKLCGLAPAASQVSVFDKYTVDSGNPYVKVDLTTSDSTNSEYPMNFNKDLTEINIITKSDISDTFSAGGDSEVTEDITHEGDEMAESDAESSVSSPQAPVFSIAEGTRFTPDGHGMHLVQNVEQQVPSGYVHSSSHRTGGIAMASFPVKMQPVLVSDYVSNINMEMNTSNELQPALSAPLQHTKSALMKMCSSARSDNYLPNNNCDPMTESQAPIMMSDMPSIAPPNEFTDSSRSSNNILATPSPSVIEVARESCSDPSPQYLPDLRQHHILRTNFNPKFTPFCPTDNENVSISLANTRIHLQSNYLQNGIQSSQNLTDTVDIIRIKTVSSNSQKELQDRHSYRISSDTCDVESNVGLTLPSPMHVAASENSSNSITTSSVTNSNVSHTDHTDGMSTVKSHIPENNTSTDSKHMVTSSAYIAGSREPFSIVKDANNPKEVDTTTDIMFVEEYSSLDEDASDSETNYSHDSCYFHEHELESKAIKESTPNCLHTVDQISFRLEPINQSSEETEDSEAFMDRYLDSNNEGCEHSNSVEQCYMLNNEGQHQDNVMVDTDSVHFNFPYQKVRLCETSEQDQWPPYEHNAANRTKSVVASHQSMRTPSISTDDEHADMLMLGSDFHSMDQSFTSSKALAPLYGYSTGTRTISPNGNVDPIKYSYDGEGGKDEECQEKGYLRDDQYVTNVPYARRPNDLNLQTADTSYTDQQYR